MKGEQRAEERGLSGEKVESPGAEPGVPVEEQQKRGHLQWAAEDAAVARLVEGERAGGERVGEEECLAEAEGETFSGDGVHRAGGVADKSDIVETNMAEPAREGEAAAFGGGGRGGTEALTKNG